MGYRRVNEPQAISASQIVVRVISAELYRSFDKFLGSTTDVLKERTWNFLELGGDANKGKLEAEG